MIVLLLIILLLLLLENNRELHNFKTERYEIHSSKIQEGTSLNFIFLSDLHSCSFGKNNEKLLAVIDQLHPDAILVGGDMITRSDPSSFQKTFSTIRKLSELAPVYYANGNHEQKLKLFPEDYALSYEELAAFIRQCGITLLENESVTVKISGNPVTITGLEIPVSGYSYFGKGKITYEEIEESIGKPAEDDTFHILLAHNPMHMKIYKKWKPDMILSGHLHGGIVRIPYLGGLIAPDFNPFPRYSGGFYKEDPVSIIVSNGLGTHSIPVRINCPAQLVHIIVNH